MPPKKVKKESAEEAEVAESLKVFFPVFIEFEDVHPDAPADEPAEKTARQAIDAALLKFFNKNIRPFQHARLVVLKSSFDPDDKADLAAVQSLPKDATGLAYDCYGSKDEPKLEFANAEEWSLAHREYKAEVQFLGYTTYNEEEIESITKQLVEEKKKYNFIFENCMHFAMDTAWHAMSEKKGIYNHFMEMKMPGGLAEDYPLISKK